MRNVDITRPMCCPSADGTMVVWTSDWTDANTQSHTGPYYDFVARAAP